MIPFVVSNAEREDENELDFSALFADADHSRIDARRYPEVSFDATHNSYSGGIAWRRSSIRAQLDRGVRSLELDIHDDDDSTHGFRVGHLAPGDMVYHEDDNPAGDALADWLKVIADWSAAHRSHAPITLLIDLKDSLVEKGFFALNAELRAAFGERLITSEQIPHGQWPTIGEMRGKILVVLSGDEESRVAYRGQHAKNPAAAINRAGAVVVVHDDGDDELWSWTGRYSGDGGVRWARLERYDSGENPAVAIDDSGVVVEVHQSGRELWYRLGRTDNEQAIVWAAESGIRAKDFEGDDPAIDFERTGDVRLTYVGENGVVRAARGHLHLSTGRITWRSIHAGRHDDETRAAAGGRAIHVFTGADGGFDRDTLLYSTDRAAAKRVRPEQLAFVEVQHGNESALERDGLHFYSGPAAELSARVWAAGKRAAGKVARLWCFNDVELTHEASVNFPATDLPFSRWYRGYGDTLGCAR